MATIFPGFEKILLGYLWPVLEIGVSFAKLHSVEEFRGQQQALSPWMHACRPNSITSHRFPGSLPHAVAEARQAPMNKSAGMGRLERGFSGRK